MADAFFLRRGPARADEKPHTVPAGILDAFLGNRGADGELLRNGVPVILVDTPAEDDEDDDV